jgi:hypothetical protein
VTGIRPCALAAGTIAVATIFAAQCRKTDGIEERQLTGRPVQQLGDGYLSSTACRRCHPDNHASWSASFHRTMTQLPSPEVVIAPFDGRELRRGDARFRMLRRGDELWVAIEDPGGRTEKRVVLVTGSHHMQRYWVSAGPGRPLASVPFVYLREDRRWIPVEAAFLHPEAPSPGLGLGSGDWNTNCINCHTTRGRISATGREDDYQARVAELGIACEACHGPGATHVALRGQGPIVDPSRLEGRRSAEVCGQCHAVLLDKISRQFPVASLLAHGRRYRPGQELGDTHVVVRPTDPGLRALMDRLMGDPSYLARSFWADGMVRVSGREYNGLVESPCARGGQLTCLSCHTMHPQPGSGPSLAAWADDQLGPEMDGDRACLQCHQRYAGQDQLVAHTHHRPGSEGSRCYNCHMPFTTWGLLRAIRSHQISSPGVGTSVLTGRPNACNQCHLDRTLAWAAGALARWYRLPAPALAGEESSIAASALWLLRGDAGQRALMAWSFGWPAAWQAAGSDWLAPCLAQLLEDPYPAVRYAAQRSLRRLPGFGAFEYDFTAPPAERAAARTRALAVWQSLPESQPRSDPAVLMDHGRWDERGAARLVSHRDDRVVQLQE